MAPWHGEGRCEAPDAGSDQVYGGCNCIDCLLPEGLYCFMRHCL